MSKDMLTWMHNDDVVVWDEVYVWYRQALDEYARGTRTQQSMVDFLNEVLSAANVFGYDSGYEQGKADYTDGVGQ